jgi:hypothetical protein
MQNLLVLSLFLEDSCHDKRDPHILVIQTFLWGVVQPMVIINIVNTI